MNVSIDANLSLDTDVPKAKALAQMADIKGSLEKFPKVRSVTEPAPGIWLSKTAPIGAAGVSHSAAWAARYTVDPAAGTVKWKAERGHGSNAMIDGEWRISELPNGGTRFSLTIKGELNDVSVPLLLRPAAGPFIKQQFTQYCRYWLERVRDVAAKR